MTFHDVRDKMAINVIVDGLDSGPLCLQGEGALPVASIRRLVADSFDRNVSGIGVFAAVCCLESYLICLSHPPQGIKNMRFRLQMRSRVLEDDDMLEYDQGDSFLTVNVVPSLQGGKGGEWREGVGHSDAVVGVREVGGEVQVDVGER